MGVPVQAMCPIVIHWYCRNPMLAGLGDVSHGLLVVLADDHWDFFHAQGFGHRQATYPVQNQSVPVYNQWTLDAVLLDRSFQLTEICRVWAADVKLVHP